MAETATEDDTDKYQNILEQAIVENNIHDFNQAISELQTKERIDNCLSKAYHRLKLFNVPIHGAIETSVVETLVSQRFFCDKTADNLKDVPVTFEDVHERIDRLVKLIDKLTAKFTGMTLVKNLFVCVCQLTAIHLHILKYQLKSTYDKLPWAEMEFYFVALVLNIVRPQEADDIFKLVLHRGRVLQHLDNFKKGLLKLKPELDGKCINRKVRLGNRTQIVQSVLTFLPEFQDLYDDYDLIKDISSLRRIDGYISISNTLEFDCDVEQDKLVVERTLQVIGETLKSTPDSPNVSEEVQEMFVRSNGENLKEVLTALRDSLSHTESLFQKVDIENSNTPEFFQSIRDDLAKIHVEIVRILFKRRLKALEIFSKNVLHCKDVLEIRNLAENIDSFRDITMCDIGVKDITDIENLMEEMTEALGDPSPEVKVLLDKVDRILQDEKAKVNVLVGNYTTLTRSVRFAICEIKRSNDFTYIKHLFAMILEVLANSNEIGTSLRSIGEPILQIKRSVQSVPDFENNDRIAQIFNDILHIAMLSSATSSHIDKFKTNLENSDITDNKDRRYIDGILEKVQRCLKTEPERVAFQKAVASKKEVSEMRLELITLINNKLSQPTDADNDETVMSLLKQFKLRKQTEEMFINNYTNGTYSDCMDTVKKIDDTYGVFVKTMSDLDVFSYLKQQKALKLFLSSLKVKKFLLEDVMQDFIKQSESEINLFITERTNMLKKNMSFTSVENVVEFVNEIHAKNSLKLITELVLLDVMNVLQKASLFVDDKLFFEDTSPLLLGQSLRKYLAHGNTLVDILPFDADRTLACNAFRILQERETLLKSKDILIGKKGTAKLLKSKFYLEGFEDLIVQNLFYASIRSNNVENVLECLNQGANVLGRDIDDQNALHFAASRDSLESLLFCLNKGLNQSSSNIFGHTPLEIAVQNGSKRCFKYYLEQPDANVDIDELFIMAAKFNQMEILMMLLQRFRKDISTGALADTIEFTSELGYNDILHVILDKFGKRDRKMTDVGALHLACFYGHNKTVELLLSHGFDINKVMENGLLAIHAAIIGGHCDIVELLLENGSLLDSNKVVGIDRKQHKKEEMLTVSPTTVTNVLVNHMTFRDATASMEPSSTALCTACTLNRPGIVELLIKAGADVNQVSQEYSTPLHQASENGATEIVEILLKNGADVNKAIEGNVTSVHSAANCGHLDVLDKLVVYDCDLNATTVKGKTPLHLAVAMGHRHIVDFLLQKGVEVNAVDSDGYSVLHLANKTGDVTILNLLLELDATNINLADNDGNTALHYAASYGNVACVESLLTSDAHCDVANAVNARPLVYAIEGRFVSIVETLLDHGADPNSVYLEGHGPLHLASKQDMPDVVNKLLRRSANVNASDPTGVTPLHVAASYGQGDVTAVLINSGARIDAGTVEGYTPLFLAARGGHRSVVDALCNNGANVELADSQEITPLLIACSRGHRRVVERLLSTGADVWARDAAGATVAHVAALGGHLDIIRLLSDFHGTKILNARTSTGETVLHMGAESGNAALVSLLLQLGAEINAVDEEGFTPLHVACQGKVGEVVGVLIKAGARVGAKADGGVTPLHMAAEKGTREVVGMLIKAGANVEDVLEDTEETALHVAAEEGNVEVVGALLEAGARVGVRDVEGRTPLDRAVGAAQAEVVEVLLGSGDVP